MRLARALEEEKGGPVWGEGGCQVEEQGRGPGGRQRPGTEEAGTGRAAHPHVRGGTGGGHAWAGPKNGKWVGPNGIEEFLIYSKEFRKEAT
jgi:hypothetical protein